MTQSIQKQIGFLPAIESKAHLFEIGRKVFCTDMVPSSHDSALKKRKCIFNSIGMNVANYIDFLAVIDGLVLVLVDARMYHLFGVADPIIGNDPVHIDADAVLEVFGERFGFGILDVIESEIAPALPDANYNFFLGSMGSASTTSHAADIGFIHLHGAIQHLFINFNHRCADSMAEVPRGFVTDANGPLNLAGRHSLFGLAQQQGSHKPLCQRQMGVIKDRASRHGELVVTVFAVEQFLVSLQLNSSLLAARAFDANGPAETAQQF